MTHLNKDIIRITWKAFLCKGQLFCVKVYPDGEKGNHIPEFVVELHKAEPINPDKITVSDTHIMWWEEVVRFNFLPDWTQDNIQEKLESFLTFL